MNKYGLVSNYTIKQFKVHKAKYNNENIANIVNREFDEITVIEPKNTIILVVARFGNTRLLDNIWL